MRDSGIEAIRDKNNVQSLAWLARQLGVTRGAISHWRKVPAERLGEISKITGIKHEVLRPDLFEKQVKRSKRAAQ